MGRPIEITNLEHSATDLRRLKFREKRGEVVSRLTNNGSAQDALLALLDTLEANTGEMPNEVSADNGFCSEANLFARPPQRWLAKFEHWDKWNFCLNSAMMLGNRSDDDEAYPP